ncbi:CHAP domain protein [Bifidobacterium saguini DSM 23967]|uniref:N-acetylmuramoyl-L-alanine amidase n=2 Tax=Bifidobacterium saguini TaxID=762210 RepID=A0A087D5Y6_9BIFI|nr:CHAP domain-containing protein [Bifidobacterium saguini]KFI90936.1 CHAP domain protein [Bifidobacterium saguini DSM 23967]QTB91428.1 CHAP domain-containing protein [Bifidobacterium saguini]
MNIDQFIQTYNGKTVDVDKAYGGQCWDLWSRYAQDVAGVPQSATHTSNGYAGSVYTGTWNKQPALRAKFDRLPASATPRKGDVAFWGNAPATPHTHVAIVLADQGGSLLCLTQNPGATHQGSITKNGLLGYLRPKTVAGTSQSNGIAGAWRVNVAKLNVRAQPSTGAQIVAQYSAGQTVNLDGWTTRADGYDWGRYIGASSGKHRYIALGPAGTTSYLTR